jgi:hypothetical protein
MKWWMLAIAAYVLLGLQVAFKALSVSTPYGPIDVEFILLLAVWIGLWAPPQMVVPVCGLLGVLLDLTTPLDVMQLGADGQVVGKTALTLVGPYTLGYFAAGGLLLQMRPMLFRQHPLTVASMVVAAGAAAHMVVAGVFTARAIYEPLAGWSGSGELIRRAMGLLLTGAVAFAFAIPLSHLKMSSAAISSGGRRGRR